MRAVGKNAGEMLANLTAIALDPKKLEIVGLSLGAHTAGLIGKNYKALTGQTILRLTGLDPSGPCFRNLGPEDRIDQTDADQVDIIATNIDGYGMAAPVGHVNFYVNGGEIQNGDIYWMLCGSLCSHMRTYTIWMAALTYTNEFIAIQCDSVQQARDRKCYDRRPMVTNVLGINTDFSKPGVFYLATDNIYPFYLGEKGLKRSNEFFKLRLSEINAVDIFKF